MTEQTINLPDEPVAGDTGAEVDADSTSEADETAGAPESDADASDADASTDDE